MSEDMAAIVATAAAVAIGTAQAAETCATGSADPQVFVAVAAVNLERLTNSFNYCATRRAQIEAGHRGDLAAAHWNAVPCSGASVCSAVKNRPLSARWRSASM